MGETCLLCVGTGLYEMIPHIARYSANVINSFRLLSQKFCPEVYNGLSKGGAMQSLRAQVVG